jgi:endonuclease VIII
MPEGDTIFRAARTLHRALAGQMVTRFETVLPHLARVEVDRPITGRTVEKVEAHGKWLTMSFSSDLILLTHMLMSGSWHIYRPGERWQRSRIHMRIVIEAERIHAVAFNVQIAEFHSADSLRRRIGFKSLGQSLLAETFDDAVAITAFRQHPNLEIGEALLKQSVVAGIGNVFKSEICFAAQINPFREVSSINEAEAAALISSARKFLQMNVADFSRDQITTYTPFRRTTHHTQPEDRLWVYHRAGQPCRRCGTPIASQKQGPSARTTFWCPRCQPTRSAAVAVV